VHEADVAALELNSGGREKRRALAPHAQVEKDTEVKAIKKEGNAKLEEGDVQVDEAKEDIKSSQEIFREMSIFEIQVFEWGAQCADLQQKITKVKYDNQIEMAKMKQQIEA